MADLTLPELSKKMAKMDFAMMSTVAMDGGLTARPMSNNGDVEYDGVSYFAVGLRLGPLGSSSPAGAHNVAIRRSRVAGCRAFDRLSIRA